MISRSPEMKMRYIDQCAGVSVIIPAFNEERRLPNTLAELQRFSIGITADFEVIVVDDGSSDGTVDLVRREALSLPWLSVLECPHRGKGAAVRSGMLAARYDRVVLCDADLSMPVEQIQRLTGAIARGCDVAIGSRELTESRRYDDPLRRRLMSRVFGILVRVLVIKGVHDTQCGFKAFRRDVAQDLFSRQTLDGFSFDVEILFLARKRHYLVEEVAIDWFFNADSRVRAGSDTLGMVADLLRIRLRAFREGYGQPGYPRVGRPLGAVDETSLQIEAAVGPLSPAD